MKLSRMDLIGLGPRAAARRRSRREGQAHAGATADAEPRMYSLLLRPQQPRRPRP